MGVSAVTNRIRVSVEVNWQAGVSRPYSSQNIFSYHITIENQGESPVQLLRRYWFILESTGESHEVEGEGVVGETPVIKPGQAYRYQSFCNLNTEMGSMQGYYTMLHKESHRLFEVEIPQFVMATPAILN